MSKIFSVHNFNFSQPALSDIQFKTLVVGRRTTTTALCDAVWCLSAVPVDVVR